MKAMIAWLRKLPVPARWAVFGAASVGLLGAVIGLVVGLRTYAPTAWFAVIELGLPAAVVGGIVGLASGLILVAARTFKRELPPAS